MCVRLVQQASYRWGKLDPSTRLQDPSYPSTHVVVRLDGVVARIELDSTLRRCVAVEAVVAGDSIAVSFRADPAQWPEPRASRDASDQADEQADENEREA